MTAAGALPHATQPLIRCQSITFCGGEPSARLHSYNFRIAWRDMLACDIMDMAACCRMD